MSEVCPTYDDQIDLFKILWDGKWIITAFTAIAVLVGSYFIYAKDSVYQSKIVYSIETYPPFYSDKKIIVDFEKYFYSKSIFDEWKKNISTSLIFEDFSKTKAFDSFLMSKNEGALLATLVSQKKGISFILVKTNQLSILDDFFKYANHINGILKNDYVTIAKYELNTIESTLGEKFDSSNIKALLSTKRFIFSSEKNNLNILTIQSPTMPENISPKNTLILLISVVLGGMTGVLFIHILYAIRKRKEQLAKA